MTEPLFASASPVFEVDGETRGELARDVLHLSVEEDTQGLRRLQARLIAFGPAADGSGERLLYLDGRVFDFGKAIRVSIGPEGGAKFIFQGRISGIEADFKEAREPEVFIFAEDELMSLRMTRRMRTYEDMSDADIAAAIAAEHGLTPAVDAAGPVYDLVHQANTSDLAFLRERARLVQAEVWVDGETLHFTSRERRRATELTMVQGNELISLQARADLAHQRTAVRVCGYDATNRETIDERAGEEAIQAEVIGGRTGPGVLSTAFGERVSFRVREVPLAANEAADWARNEMRRRARAFVQVSGVSRGTPDIMVGSRLTLERIGQPFEGGGYYVTRYCHTYDLSNGHRTRFDAERPTISVS
jgi:phage protein D